MDGITPETCAECGFDSRSWRRRDVVSYLGALGIWWRLAIDGIDADDLNRRPAPGVWSALEYGVHIALVNGAIREGLALLFGQDGAVLPAPPVGADADQSESPSDLDPAAVLADRERETAALLELSHGAPRAAWGHVGMSPVGTFQAEAVFVHAAHDASHHGFDVARGLTSLGLGTPTQQGTVLQVNRSGGGVPKAPIEEARIEADGVVGDQQADGKHHGRPFQALSLWSTEVIDRLAADGHSITPGAAGENLSLTGIDWDTIRPGALVRIGDVMAEVSFPATPCAKQTRWFTDGDFRRLDHDRNPGLTRWYAWVRGPGTVRAGDPVTVG